jgi:MFS family permease
LVASYTISAGVIGLLTAPFMDRYDRRRVLLISYAGFFLGTLACALSHNANTLLIARAICGAFGGISVQRYGNCRRHRSTATPRSRYGNYHGSIRHWLLRWASHLVFTSRRNSVGRCLSFWSLAVRLSSGYSSHLAASSAPHLDESAMQAFIHFWS